ncbi:Calcium-transporting ATPase [Sinobacterium norvegicum]|uniref:Calcium-transporting ATPase n=1 Tax=Sinobacterium norvegicum TaxID=1641715 RepID=A0ABN8EF07_9GAMM|nr:alkaline phosphatase family protein [Sinobacterium norvegicum]CAH0990995.1 Calcium-transporting ATPase [Sinobacterium norvegicum]
MNVFAAATVIQPRLLVAVFLPLLITACAPPNNADDKKAVNVEQQRPAIASAEAQHSASNSTPTKKPKLILQITVDQLRGDLASRYLDNMGDGGFRYLLDRGVVYKNAQHGHASTETIVGHTTLATGAQPAVHGMVGNGWFDRSTGKLNYNIEDNRYALLSDDGDVNDDTEIDPDQRAASTDGRSPAAILVTTFGDELALNTAGKAKVFGVSVKDRGAVSMAGHAGKAFWFSKASGEFVTSNYYYDQYPEWVTVFNSGQPAQRYADTDWQLLLEPSAYLFADRDDQAWETDIAGFGKTFPHPYGAGDGPYYTTLLTLSPAGDELTLDFAKQLISHEQLGQGDGTDYLSVSFSSTDYVGHIFGISSLESEDNLLRLDRTITELLSHVDNTVGLDNTVIVLSADHGGPDAPPQQNEYGIEAQYFHPDQWLQQSSFAAIEQRFGVGKELILQFRYPYLYLNRELIRRKGLNQAAVEQAFAEQMKQVKGVHLAISTSDLIEGRSADNRLSQQLLNNYQPSRSGDVVVVFEPHWFINDFDGLTVTSTHGSPWRYDTFVPMIFVVPGVPAQTVYREVATVDLALTLSALMDINQPSGASGRVLKEVLAQ